MSFDFDLHARNSKDSKRWYLDNDENPNVVLEQSPNKDALCPEEVNHWLSYCNTYRQIRLVSENFQILLFRFCNFKKLIVWFSPLDNCDCTKMCGKGTGRRVLQEFASDFR